MKQGLRSHRVTRANYYFIIGIMILTIFSPIKKLTGQELPLTQYVDPFIGTAPNPFIHVGLGADPGSVFPGAVCPNGMLAWSPDTYHSYKVAGGYWYPDSLIIDFSLTHFSGRGVVCLKDICFMPVNETIKTSPGDDWYSFASSFSHSNETSQPGYYRVKFDNGIETELTATPRTGMGRFTYPVNSSSTLLIRADGEISVNGNEVTGYRNALIGGKQRKYTIYFAAEFDHPFKGIKTWTMQGISSNSEAKDDSCGAILTFDTEASNTIQVKVGISYVSIDNAKENLKAENGGRDFETVKHNAEKDWNKVLNTVQISGGDKENIETFYTALYHCFMHPNLIDDVNGQYTGMDLKVHKAASGHHQFQNIPAWDEHRSHSPLIAMLDPNLMSDIDQSLINYAEQDKSVMPNGGGFPRWEQVYRNSGGMVGDGDCQIISTTYAFGAKDFDAKAALEIMKRGATIPDITSDGFKVRDGLKEFMEIGYMPLNGSKNLEYCNDDFAISEYAKAMGDEIDYKYFRNRSQNWKLIFDTTMGLIRPRNADGSWVEKFSPITGAGFTEGTAVQYTWMINFNLRGLIDKMGGDTIAIERLNRFFVKLNAKGQEGTVRMGNEPGEGVPWAYDFAGAPWLTQQVVRRAEKELYTNKPDGLPGNDDAGALSSWYVLAALGIYPEIPGTDILVLGSPLFEKAVLHLKNGAVTIIGKGANENSPYVQSLRVNGKGWTKTWIRFSDISNGGEMEYELSSTPNKRWGSDAEDAPPSFDTIRN